MKMTLTVDYANPQEVVSTYELLAKLLPKEYVMLEGGVNCQTRIGGGDGGAAILLSELYSSQDSEALNVIDPSLMSERDALLREVEDLKIKNKALVSSNKELKADISTAKAEVDAVKAELSVFPEVPGFGDEPSVEVVDAKEYELKIEKLEKDVTFHENRSNKNFEEIKRLRVNIDAAHLEIKKLEKEIKVLSESNSVGSGEDVEKIKKENEDLLSKVENMTQTKEKLKKEVEFQKERSSKNWEEIKVLKVKIAEIEKEKESLQSKVKENSIDSDNINNKEEVSKLKAELVTMKSNYDALVEELRLNIDKLKNEMSQNENNSLEDELSYLKLMQSKICSNENGLTFWNRIESTIKNR